MSSVWIQRFRQRHDLVSFQDDGVMWLEVSKLFSPIRVVFHQQRSIQKILKYSNQYRNLIIRENTTKRAMDGEQPLGVPLKEVLAELYKVTNIRLAESWDNVGLLIEPYTEQTIRNVLLTNDLTENVMEEAINKDINLIISYHPPIFAPLKRITKESWKERIVAACLENKIAVFSPHTCWDAVGGGITDWLAEAFAEYTVPDSLVPLKPIVLDSNLFIVTLLGDSAFLDNICQKHGLQNIPHSSDFEEKHSRIIVCSKDILNVLKTIKGLTIAAVQLHKNNNPECGMGRLLKAKGLNISTAVQLIKKHTNLPFIRLAHGVGKTDDSEVSTIALVPGSGGSLLKNVNVDLFLTGEMFHHDILDANHNGTSVILTNHSDSERGFLPIMSLRLKKIFSSNLNVLVSSADRDPLKTV